MKINENEFMLVEKYRPSSVDDVIIPGDIRSQFKEWIDKGFLPNMLLSSSTPGLGKSSISKAAIEDLGAETLFINASLENGIDILRTKIQQFASTVSFDGGPKVVILDEFDHFSSNAQAGMRGFIEEYSKNCSFIITCNYKDKIIEPLQDRLIKFDFDDIFAKNKKEIGVQIFKRLKFILKNESIEHTDEQIKQITLNLYPGVRDMIMFIQNNTKNNILKISDNVHKSYQYRELVECIKNKDFTKMRQSVQELVNPDGMYSFLFKHIDEFIKKEYQHIVILIIAKYQYQSTQAVDKEINLAAMCTELMGAKIEFI